MAPSAIPTDSTTNMEDPTISSLKKILTSETSSLARQFRALFSLKHLACLNPPTEQTVPAISAIAAGLSSPSELLKHELAYCLGQTRNPAAVPYLRAALEDKAEAPMCRHEAAEALGALGYTDTLQLLKEIRDDPNELEAVRETCELAVARIEWEHSRDRQQEKLRPSDFASIDPAPPMPEGSQPPSIPELQDALLNTNLSLFERYRAMFALRDLASPPDLPTAVPAVQSLALGLKDKSALFRHEIAFVFGQLCHPASIPALEEALRNKEEASMVRHEAAEALGSLGDEEGVDELLKEFLNDPEQVVKESILVALDMAEFEKNGEMEYAIVPGQEAPLAGAA
ncbi:Deoxyhypusine hydroxylase [Xylona heveae TC161]|uniref:Deoxyhypusine hydroxylase n=1 Tax=Xylona heveae (strain CBS 132557 / TC161) TaxID=1328760 RepID=A0A165HCA9_XYLHT|nr:Deoxyhypusine hydroxylase [Xylona heveae TC161]KZF23289.1 Deoxyhypusine hydroxylase [Xylona heveae TC161]